VQSGKEEVIFKIAITRTITSMYFPKEGIRIPKAVRYKRAGGMEISQYRVYLREGGHVFGILSNVSMDMAMTGMMCKARMIYTAVLQWPKVLNNC
jgi:hypothetical protein